MLAAWTDYLKYWWWLPTIIIFLIGWIFGGGFVLRWSIRRRKPDAKADVGRCLLAIALAGAAGAVSGLVILKLFQYIGRAAGVSLIIPGFIFGAAALLVVGYLSVYAIFTLSTKETLIACAPAGAGVLALGILILLGAGLPAYYSRQRNIRKERARGNMLEVAVALTQYQNDSRRASMGRGSVHLPDSLDVLVEKNIISASKLASAGPGSPPKYFYRRPDSGELSRDDTSLIACEIRARDGGRAILLGSGDAEWIPEKEFQNRLAHPENKQFADAFRATAGK